MAGVNQNIQQFFPDASVAPAAETPLHVLPVAQVRRQISPGRARSHNPENRVNEQPIVFGYYAPVEEAQTIKNQGNRRRVPVHSDLERLGFLQYVRSVSRKKKGLLFPNLEKGSNGYGDAVGRWFARLLRHHLQITGRAYVLHSLRHTVITRLSGAGVPENLSEMLVGHASDMVH